MASLLQRNGTWYLQWSVNGRVRRRSLRTRSKQLAREKLRQFESALFRGEEPPTPTRTPIPDALDRYVAHIRSVKTAKSAQADVYVLRDIFGPCCDALRCTSRRPRKRSSVRRRSPVPAETESAVLPDHLEAACFEHLTTTAIAGFISDRVRQRGLSPKTANRYREILVRLFNWSIRHGGVIIPGDRNPAAAVERYRERAPVIRFLTLPQIDEQLHALRFQPKLQAMVAVLIYAGLRREELLWLTRDDVDLPRSPGGRSGRGVIRVRAKCIATAEETLSWQPKTRVNRAVPVSSALRDVLERYTPPPSSHDWFFPSPAGTLWDPDNFSADLRNTNREAGLPWSCLDFRHTFGSQLAQKGVSLYKIATLMGNSPEICRRHYAALIPEALVEEVEFAAGQDPFAHRSVRSA